MSMTGKPTTADESDESSDPVVRQRQMNCRHAFIPTHPRPSSGSYYSDDKAQRCVHCGVSYAVWEKMRNELAMAYAFGGGP